MGSTGLQEATGECCSPNHPHRARFTGNPPDHIAIQLQLRELEQREVILAGGHRRKVLGNEVLLGAIPMQDMDLVLRPR